MNLLFLKFFKFLKRFHVILNTIFIFFHYSVFNAGASFNVEQITNGWFDADAYRSTFIYNFQNTALDQMAGVASKTTPVAYSDTG